jgi:hypothetical protein
MAAAPAIPPAQVSSLGLKNRAVSDGSPSSETVTNPHRRHVSKQIGGPVTHDYFPRISIDSRLGPSIMMARVSPNLYGCCRSVTFSALMKDRRGER